MKRQSILIASAGLLAPAALILSSCSGTTSAAGAPPPAPPEVEVAQVEQRNVPIYREWIGAKAEKPPRDELGASDF